MSGSLLRLGMNSTSMLDNLMPYLFILGIFVAILIFALILYMIPCIKQKIYAILKEQYAVFKWNGLLLSITVSFLKICLGLSI
jgi:hypothetical protein